MPGLIKTYELETGPAWLPEAQYVDQCNEQFRALLELDPEENETQFFFEQHPCLVPGHSTPGTPSGHWPLHCSLVSQPRLLGQDWFVPVFMWIATHSGAWYPTLIEIEKPSRKIFNQNGTPTADFTRARNQLSQWRSWFDDASNQLQFMDYFWCTAALPHAKDATAHDLDLRETFGVRRQSSIDVAEEQFTSWNR